MKPTVAQGLFLDAIIIAAVVALALAHVIPGEAALGLLASLLGARAMGRLGGGPGAGSSSPSSPPPPPALPPKASSLREVSLCAALAVGLLAFVLPHHRTA